jgi:hypothetical protein
MPIVPRVETLAVTVLWLKVPAERWEAWLCDYEQKRNLSLPRPFPPEEVLRQEEQNHRCATLGQLLGCTPAALTQRYYRELPRWFSRLECYRELVED